MLGFSIWRDNFAAPFSRITGTVSAAVSAAIEVGKRSAFFRYFFNATDSATFTSPWQPRGLPFEVSFKFIDNAAVTSTYLHGTTDVNLCGVFFGVLVFSYADKTGAAVSVNLSNELGINLETGKEYSISLLFEDDGVTATVSGYGSYKSTIAPAVTSFNDWNHIASAEDELGLLSGSVWDIKLEEYTGLEGTINVANGVHSGLLNGVIPISGDFDWKVRWERTQNSGQTSQYFIGNSDGRTTGINIYDSDSTTPDQLKMISGGRVATWNNFLAGVEDGEIVEIRIKRVGSNTTAYLNGVDKGSVTFDPQPDTIDQLLDRGGSNAFCLEGIWYDMEFTVDYANYVPHKGFLDFGANHPDILESIEATTEGDLGQLQVISPDNAIIQDSRGVKAAGVTILSWDINNTFTAQDWADMDAQGFTLQYEVEKAFFADDTGVPAGNFQALFNTGHGFGGTNVFRALGRDDREGISFIDDYTATKVLQDNAKVFNDTYDDYVRVDISFDPNAGTQGRYDFYCNKFHLIRFEPTTDISGLTLNLIRPSGAAGFIGVESANAEYFIKNIQLSKGPIVERVLNPKRVAVFGDSFMSYSQYQGDYLTDNDPLLIGIDDGSARTTFPSASNDFDARQLALYPQLHGIFADKGMDIVAQVDQAGDGTLNRIESYFYSGSGVRFELIANTALDHQIDEALTNPGYDWHIIHIGVNDATFLTSQVGEEPVQSEVDLWVSAYLTQLDRLIADGSCRIILFSIPPTPGSNNNKWVAALNEALFESIDGYKNVVTVTPEIENWGIADTDDGLHPNIVGQTRMAEAIETVVPPVADFEGIKTYRWENNEGSGLCFRSSHPSSEGFGGRWEGSNWTTFTKNLRKYNVDDGPAGNGILKDTGSDGIDATINSYRPEGWVK